MPRRTLRFPHHSISPSHRARHLWSQKRPIRKQFGTAFAARPNRVNSRLPLTTLSGAIDLHAVDDAVENSLETPLLVFIHFDLEAVNAIVGRDEQPSDLHSISLGISSAHMSSTNCVRSLSTISSQGPIAIRGALYRGAWSCNFRIKTGGAHAASIAADHSSKAVGVFALRPAGDFGHLNGHDAAPCGARQIRPATPSWPSSASPLRAVRRRSCVDAPAIPRRSQARAKARDRDFRMQVSRPLRARLRPGRERQRLRGPALDSRNSRRRRAEAAVRASQCPSFDRRHADSKARRRRGLTARHSSEHVSSARRPKRSVKHEARRASAADWQSRKDQRSRRRRAGRVR